MGGFKLLAIVPLKGCDSKFTKNLKIGEVYKFYQKYDIRCVDDDSTIQYFESLIPPSSLNLYELKNGIKINISAVVGLNGSGKSSLIELFYYFIYKLSTTQKAYGKEPIEKYSYILQNLYLTHKDYFQVLNDENTSIKAAILQNRLNLLFQNLSNNELESLTDLNYIDKIKELISEKTTQLYKEWQDELKIDAIIEKSLNVGVVYETEHGIFTLIFEGDKLEYKCLKNHIQNEELDPNFKLENLFYSISLNFSHHSLNNRTLGNWINSLFHKNDGYTTPVVINPMRNDGNFDVNHEIKLNNERLMSTVTYSFTKKDEVKLLEKYAVVKFIYREKKRIVPVFCVGLEQRSEQLKRMNNHFLLATDRECTFLNEKDFYNSYAVKMILKHLSLDRFEYDIPFLNYAIGYLENKIPKLKGTYPQFFSSTGEIVESEFEKFLTNDTSHITKKIRQTLTFLKVIYNNPNTIWESPTSYLSNHISVESFKSWLQINNSEYQSLSSLDLMEFALPGFFSVDYELHSPENKPLKFSGLSSGEQQMLFNINTIVYHLLNLQSVATDKTIDNQRIAYKNVAIILDEIELYYHPDMQRRLVKNLMDALEIVKNKGEEGVESINLCFLTHSPFILSDIPKSNIMHLSLNDFGRAFVSTPDDETFGANIHDLLANDFFLKDGFMGEFAQEKINDLINYLLFNPDQNIDEKNTRPRYEWTKEIAEEFIDLIGEPLLEYDLKEMYLTKFYDINELDKQIELLQQVKRNKLI
jgi:hypothetical protein